MPYPPSCYQHQRQGPKKQYSNILENVGMLWVLRSGFVGYAISFSVHAVYTNKKPSRRMRDGFLELAVTGRAERLPRSGLSRSE